MIRREGNDPLHFTISRRGKKVSPNSSGSSSGALGLNLAGTPNPIHGSPASEVVGGSLVWDILKLNPYNLFTGRWRH